METSHQYMTNAIINYQDITNTISLDSIIASLIVFAFFAITLISFLRSYFIKTNTDIIKIEDVDMIIKAKHSFYYNHAKYTNTPTTTYRIFLKGVNGDSKIDILYANESTYNKYNRGDIINVQKVFYKYKNSIFSEIIYARDEHYNRLQEYLDANKDTDVESLISKLSKIKKVSSPLYSIIMAILVISFIALNFLKFFI